MDSRTPTSSIETPEASKIIRQELINLKKQTVSLHARAASEAKRLEDVFQAEQIRMREASIAFVAATDDLKEIKQLLAAHEYLDGKKSSKSTTKSKSPRKKISKKKMKEKTIRRDKPLPVRRNWTDSEVERLQKCAERIDPSLPSKEFYQKLHNKFGCKKRTISSIRGKARKIGIRQSSTYDFVE